MATKIEHTDIEACVRDERKILLRGFRDCVGCAIFLRLSPRYKHALEFKSLDGRHLGGWHIDHTYEFDESLFDELKAAKDDEAKLADLWKRARSFNHNLPVLPDSSNRNAIATDTALAAAQAAIESEVRG